MDKPYFNPFNSRPVHREGDTIFVPLPVDQWGGGSRCDCPHCQGRSGYWDTLAIGANPKVKGAEWTYTVHHPTLHSQGLYQARWDAEQAAAEAEGNAKLAAAIELNRRIAAQEYAKTACSNPQSRS